MGRNILTTISVFAVFILVVVAGFFLLGIEKSALNFWALGCLLFSLVVSAFMTITFVVPKKSKDGVFYTAGLSVALVVYEIAVVLSVVYMKLLGGRLNGFIFQQIVINALFFMIAVIVIRVSGHIHESNKNAYESLQNGEYDKPKRGGF